MPQVETMSPQVDYELLERLLAAATPGPWSVDDGDSPYLGIFGENGAEIAYLIDPVTLDPRSGNGCLENDEANADLIVAAINALPTLLAERKRERAVAEGIRGEWEIERSIGQQQLDALREALEFYADPETYHGCALFFDPPTGGFDDDLDTDHGHEDYDRPMPGKHARQALAALKADSQGGER